MYNVARLLGSFPDSLFLYFDTGELQNAAVYINFREVLYFQGGRGDIPDARPPPEVFGKTAGFQENFQEEKMEYKRDELKNHFSAYVKQAVKNTKGHYLNNF